ncbi:MAG TPA: MBL fold metallo-hydrolase [Solirubrobacteraceae bacterium]|nr:MBL fold metallo-hydrolase [Solirubrobacteraceae bacterium]
MHSLMGSPKTQEPARTRATAASPRPAAGRQLEEGVHVIGLSKGRKGAYRKGGYSRAYLFEDGDRLTLVDALFDDDAQLIIDYLWSIGRAPADLTDIVLTHSHRSHIGGVATLKRISGARVWCHASEAAVVEGTESLPPIALWPLRPLALYPIRVLSYLPYKPHIPCKVDCRPEEGDQIGSLKVLHVPGHTPGNIALLWRDRVLVVADMILTWPKFGPGWPGFNGDESLYRRSLQRLLDLEPEIVCVAHGEPICENAQQLLATLDRRRP